MAGRGSENAWEAGAARDGRWRTGVVLPLLLSFPYAAALAQDAAEILVPCDGTVISEIVITPREPSFLSVPERLRPLARGVGLHHSTSKREVIRHFVLLETGEVCTEQKRAETERILRLQPFLTDATVRTVADSRGGVRIEIETIDEIPTVFGLGIRGMSPSALRFGNSNLAGRGLHLAGNLERGFAYRTRLGVDGAAYHVFGRPYTLSFAAERASLGSSLALALGHAFVTDLQRTAWHVGFRDVNRYRSYVRPEGDAVSLGIERRFWGLGGVRRLGAGRHGAFVGGLVTAETLTPASSYVIVSDSGLVADTSGALRGAVPSYSNLRLSAVVGVRALSFMAVRGFDALAAVQDVATGLQLGAVVGQGVSRFGAQDNDLFVAGDLYAGGGSATSFAGIRVQGEARWDRRTGRRDSMVGSARLAWYNKPAAAHVFVGSVEFGAGWRQRVPFQLRLGDPQGGVRGYARSRLAGAARTVVRLEQRWSTSDLTRRGSFGLSSFADAGWIRAGDAPFGADSRVKAGIGIGLLAAVPARSQRLWRIELAVPVSPDPHAGWEVRLTSVWTQSVWQEPDDVARIRAGTAPSTIFAWH